MTATILPLPPRRSTVAPLPFPSTQSAWFWTMRMLSARRDGADARFGTGGLRPCEPDDIVKQLDRLYRTRRVSLAHARVLRIYGERQIAPNEGLASERADAKLWREAMAALQGPLLTRGIVRSGGAA